MSDSKGWSVQKQSKMYGPYVQVVLGDSLEVWLAPNPAGLAFDHQSCLRYLAPTRANADKIGFLLQQLIEQVETMPRIEPGALSLV